MTSPEAIARAVQSADDGIYVTDREGNILYANEAVSRILGCDTDDLVGKHTSIFKSGAMPGEYYRRLWRTVLSGHVWRELVVNQRFDGERYEASQTITPIIDDDGSVTMMVAVQRDLTRHSQLEHEASASRTELETAVLRRDTMLRELNHRVKNDFLLVASMLHLQASRSEMAEIAEELTRAAGRIGILSEMYGLFQFPGHRTSVALPGYIEELVNFWKRTILPSTIDVRQEIIDRQISSDLAIAVGIVANELVTNAIKHALKNRPIGQLTIRTEERGEMLLAFEVCDSGPGLPAEVLTGETEGLGFSVVRSLAEQHGGCLIMSNSETGACIGVEVSTV